MTKPIEDYTADELSAKIEAIKAEREKTANALKRYEEELERRKQEFPLGVPLEDETLSNVFRIFGFSFASEDSAKIFEGRIKDYVEVLQKLAKGEPIDIQALLPLLKKGKVLYSPYDKKWKWIEQKAIVYEEEHGWFIKMSQVLPLEGFNLKPAKNWEDSLMECGL